MINYIIILSLYYHNYINIYATEIKKTNNKFILDLLLEFRQFGYLNTFSKLLFHCQPIILFIQKNNCNVTVLLFSFCNREIISISYFSLFSLKKLIKF